jgi:molybdenum cofactor biosynthesis protein B
MGTEAHKHHAPRHVSVAILIMSTTRALKDDASGNWIRDRLEADGHTVVDHQVIPDDPDAIAETVKTIVQEMHPDILLTSGGTGITPKDVTIETIRPMFNKELTAFSALFSQLSMAEIGSAAMMSRATAGVIGSTAVFCLPGSLPACKLACHRLIFPELGHIAKHLQD